MKDRTGQVTIVEAVPSEILFAAHSCSFDPAQAADRHDVGARRHEGPSLFSNLLKNPLATEGA